MPRLAERYGIEDKLYLSETSLVVSGIPSSKLNEIYNIFDVLALPTAGEGFGLPLLEAMSAGTPVIATDCTACTELLSGRGELIRVACKNIWPPYNQEFSIADAEHLSELLEKIYCNIELRSEMSRKGCEFAQALNWDGIAIQWQSLLLDS